MKGLNWIGQVKCWERVLKGVPIYELPFRGTALDMIFV
jgi:hypothetical protein